MSSSAAPRVEIKLAASGAAQVLAAFRRVGDAGRTSFGALARTSAALKTSITSTTAAVSKLGAAMGKIGSASAKVGLVGGGAAAAGLLGVGAAAKGVASEIGEITRAASAFGTSAQDLGRLAYAAEKYGVELDDLKGAFAQFTGVLAEAGADPAGDTAQMFSRLGIRVTDTQGRMRSAMSVFDDVSARLGNVANSTERMQIAMKLFGEDDSVKLMPLLRAGRGEIRRLGDEAQRLGLIFTPAQQIAAQRYNSVLSLLHGSIKGLGNAVLTNAMPGMTKLAARLTGWVLDNRGQLATLAYSAEATVSAVADDVLGLLSGTQATAKTPWLASLVDGLKSARYWGLELGKAITGQASAFDAWRAGAWEIKEVLTQIYAAATGDLNRVGIGWIAVARADIVKFATDLSTIVSGTAGFVRNVQVAFGALTPVISGINSALGVFAGFLGLENGAQVAILATITSWTLAFSGLGKAVLALGGWLASLVPWGAALSGAGSLIAAAFSAIVGAITAVGTAIVAAVGWPALLVGAFVAAAAYLGYQFWDEIKAGAVRLYDWLTGWASRVTSTISSAFAGAADFFGLGGGGQQTAAPAATAIPGFATGGAIRGPGGPTDDKIPAWLSNGEFVVRAAAVRRLGVGFLQRLNAMGPSIARFATGGLASLGDSLAMPAGPSLGGLAMAGAGGGGGGGRPINLTLPGGSTYAMRADDDVAKSLEKALRRQGVARSNSKPAWYK